MKPVNIYHCCVQKTGSQWIKAILSDDLVLEKTGLTIHTYHKYLPGNTDPRILTERFFHQPFPENCILTPLYMDYNSYMSIPKPACYRAFSIIRDPRDIIVSWYFSVKYSHPLMGKIPRHREILNRVPPDEGLIYCIEYLKEYGLFSALKSWVSRPGTDPSDSFIKLFRFEDLVNMEQQLSLLTDLFSHCHFQLTGNDIKYLMEKYRLEEMKKKAQKNQPGNQGISHYRKGIPGDWQNYFNEKVQSAFAQHLGDLLKELGYRE